MSALALSVLLSLVSAVAYAGGAIVQEQVAASSPGPSTLRCAAPAGGRRSRSTASAVCCTWWPSRSVR
ncbi:hypothetical protein SVIOM342S_10327 [Streptomyces violaceorubidus]